MEALLAIEELAAPDNRPHLEAKLGQLRVANPWLDPAESPECLALQLWLLSSYKFIDGKFTDVVVEAQQPSGSQSPGAPKSDASATMWKAKRTSLHLVLDWRGGPFCSRCRLIISRSMPLSPLVPLGERESIRCKKTELFACT